MAKDKKPTVIKSVLDKKSARKNANTEMGDAEFADVFVKPNDVVADPVTGTAVKAKALTVYKSLSGNIKMPIYILNQRGEDVKVYAHFKEGTLTTADPQYIKQLDEKIAEYDEQEVPLKQRDVVTEEQYLSIVSPDKLYVPYKDGKLHLSRVKEGLKFAESKGWVPDYSEVLHINLTKKGKVRSGALSAGSAGG